MMVTAIVLFKAEKYTLTLRTLLSQKKISFSLESILGKLASLEVAVTAGMWYCRNQYATIARAKTDSSARKQIKNAYLIPVSDSLKEEHVDVFLEHNKGSPCRKFSNIYSRKIFHQMPQ